jgi:predicted nucleic acid-binding protein
MVEPRKPRVFLDSSALIAAIMSPSDNSVTRQMLRLGELGAIDLRISREVIRDAEAIIRRRDPQLLPLVAVMIDAANIATTLDPGERTIDDCLELTGYRPDARVLAAAVECDADLFVTFDTVHFLQNPLIGPPRTRLRVMKPYEALEAIWRLRPGNHE